MLESEYITLTNQAKIADSLYILKSVLPGKEYGIDETVLFSIINLLTNMEDRLRERIEIDA